MKDSHNPSLNPSRSKTYMAFLVFIAISISFLIFVPRLNAGVITSSGTTAGKPALETAINADGDATFAPNVEGIIFSIDENSTEGSAVNIKQPNKRLVGSQADLFTSDIQNLVNNLFAKIASNEVYTFIFDDVNQTVGSLSTKSLPYIKSAQGVREINGYITVIEAGKWIRLDYQSQQKANGFGIVNMRIGDVKIVYNFSGNPNLASDTEKAGVVNTFIGNNTKVVVYNSFGSFTGNDFHDISITVNSTENNNLTHLAGGGIIGLRSIQSSTTIDNISGNLFRNISVITNNTKDPTKISGPFIQGGGIIGLDAVFSPIAADGIASLNTLKYNIFTDIKVNSRDLIMGGGIIGLNNNSLNHTANTYIYLGDVENNIFGNGSYSSTNADIEITTAFSLAGGGIIGENATANAPLNIQNIASNIFAGIRVKIGTYLRGGGIIGFQNDDESDKYDTSFPNALVAGKIESVTNNLFTNIEITTGNSIDDPLNSSLGGSLIGGGIIGGRSKAGYSMINTVSGNVFDNITIRTMTNSGAYPLQSGDLIGGGIIGITSGTSALIDKIERNSFYSINIDVAGNLSGGGLIGVYSYNSNPYLATNNIDESSIAYVNQNIIENVFVDIKQDLYGGGLIGGRIMDTTSNLPMTGAGFISQNYITNSFVEAESIHGAGIIGFYADSGTNVFINELTYNTFFENIVRSEKYIEGGGLIGIYDEGVNVASYFGTISNNTITSNVISAVQYIDGGGIIGVNAKALATNIVGILEISDNSFNNNIVIAENGQIMAGLMYSYGLSVPAKFENNVIINNIFVSDLSTPTEYAPDANIASSFARKVYGTVVIDTGLSRIDKTPNTITLSATSNHQSIFKNNRIVEGDLAIYGPIIENNDIEDIIDTLGKPNSFYFGTILLMDPSGAQITVSNDSPLADAYLIVQPETNAQIYLYDPIEVYQKDFDTANTGPVFNRTFQMDVTGTGDFYWGGSNVFVVGDYDSNVHDVPNEINLKSGSRTTLLEGMSLEATSHDFILEQGAYLEPLGFDSKDNKNLLKVNNATLQGEIMFPISSIDFNNPDGALLKISSPNKINVEGATISLRNFTAVELLNNGDMFYLFEGDYYDSIEGTPQNATATAMQNLSVQYTFIVDFEAADNTPGNTNRKMVARLVSIEPAPQTKTVSEGYAASLAFLSHIGNWLPDYTYYAADLATRQSNAWQSFSGVDFASFKAKTGSSVSVKGFNFVLGIAKKHQNALGSLLLGAYVEGGVSSFDVYSDIYTQDLREVGGGGHIRSLGVGLMVSETFNNSFRIETSFRYGKIRNDFRSKNYVSASGTEANYSISVPYVGAHVGLGYTWDIADFGNLDFSVKYFMTHVRGQNIHIGDTDVIAYESTTSKRIRAGIRFTKTFNDNISGFIGGYYDREYDNQAKAKVYGMDLQTVGLKGATGMFELGAIVKSSTNEHLSVEFGLQGYTGVFKGISGGIRLGYEF